MTREEFIEGHLLICHRSGSKRGQRMVAHRGRGGYKNRSEHGRKRNCAIKLYNRFIKYGVELNTAIGNQEFFEKYVVPTLSPKEPDDK